MHKADGGAIVNTASILGLLGDANAVPYVTTKHGLPSSMSCQDQLGNVQVRDLFGRDYRPVRHRKHWYLPASAGVRL